MSDLSGAALSLRRWHEGAGRRAVALHCSLGHVGAWSALAGHLPGLDLTAMDLPGHGRAVDLPAGADLHDQATAMGHALLDAMPDSPDLIGHSFGATVALRLALERPGRLRSLTLIEPVLFSIVRGSRAFAEFAQGYGRVGAAIADDPEAAVAAFHAVWGHGRFADLPPAQRAYMVARMPLVLAQNPALLDDTPGMIRPGRLEGLDLPVLLLEGGDSPPVIAAIQGALAARLPQASRAVISGAAHMLPITHAGTVADRISAHLDLAADLRTG